LLKKKASLQNIQNLEQTHEEVERQIKILKEEEKFLREETKKLDYISTIDIPRLQFTLSLYANISRIKWVSNPAEPLNISGVATQNGTPKPFDFNPKKQSSFEITNELWEIIAES